MPVERGRVRGVRGAGGPGGARRRGGPDLARWDSDRDGGGSRWAPQIFFLAFKKLFDTYLCLNMFKLV